MGVGAIIGIVIGSIVGLLLVFFLITFLIYWFNLDMKLVYFIYKLLGKHYDKIERDKKI